MQERKIKITNNSGRNIKVINGTETVLFSHGEEKTIYAKEDFLNISYNEPKKMSLKVLKHPDLSLKNLWQILIGFLVFFDCKVNTESCYYNSIVITERNYTYGYVIAFSSLKANNCKYSLSWHNKTDKKICSVILYTSSIIWSVITFLFFTAGLSLVFEEFSIANLIITLIFATLNLLGASVFRSHKRFLNISKNTEKILLDSHPITIIESSKHYIKFKSVE